MQRDLEQCTFLCYLKSVVNCMLIVVSFLFSLSSAAVEQTAVQSVMLDRSSLDGLYGSAASRVLELEADVETRCVVSSDWFSPFTLILRSEVTTLSEQTAPALASRAIEDP